MIRATRPSRRGGPDCEPSGLACIQQPNKKADRLAPIGFRSFHLVARPEGFEPPTPKFVAWCSIQLSYGRNAEAKLCRSGRRSVNVWRERSGTGGD